MHDLLRLASVLAAADADVIYLHPGGRPDYADRSEDVDQALLLSRALDMQLAWGPAIDEPRPGIGRRASTATRCSPGCRSWSATCTGCPGAASRAPRCARCRAGRRRPVGDRDPPDHQERRPGRAGGRLAALHTAPMEAGVLVGDFNPRPPVPGRHRAWDPLRARLHRRRPGSPPATRREGSNFRGWNRLDDEGPHPPGAVAAPRIVETPAWVSPGRRKTVDGSGAGRRRRLADHLPLMVDLQVPSGRLKS